MTASIFYRHRVKHLRITKGETTSQNLEFLYEMKGSHFAPPIVSLFRLTQECEEISLLVVFEKKRGGRRTINGTLENWGVCLIDNKFIHIFNPQRRLRHFRVIQNKAAYTMTSLFNGGHLSPNLLKYTTRFRRLELVLHV